jgi:dephospho-CoA kinase
VSEPVKYVPVIGFIGGVGSGKSFLTGLLQKQHRIAVVDGDRIGHQVLGDAGVRERIRNRFGDAVFQPDGQVNRKALAKLVFGDGASERQARAELEQIVHPIITQQIQEQITQAQQRPELEAVILDAALLLEAGWRRYCTAVIFVDTPFALRLSRVHPARDWTETELRSREASQLSLESKRREADYVVDNSHSPEVVRARLEQIFRQIQQQNLNPTPSATSPQAT